MTKKPARRPKRVLVDRPVDRFVPEAYKRASAVVLGLGRSGLAVSNLLAKNGFKVLASDEKPRKEVRAVAAKLHADVKWEGGGHSERVLRAGFAVKSPGMRPTTPILRKLDAEGIPVFSELEVALAFCRSRRVIAITGTNGKSTTTLLTAAVFQAGGGRAHALGNLGTPLAAAVGKVRAKDWLILEVSSYQLEDSRYLHPEAGALLNVTADHIDHHGTMERYVAAKARLFSYQHKRDACVFNGDDPIAVRLSRSCGARRLFFSHRPSALSHAWIDGDRLKIRLPGSKKEVTLKPPRLPGTHNLENAMAAALLALDRGLKPAAIDRAFKAFRGVEHRLEEAGTVRGVRCINDSKATNVDSTATALRSFPEAGGAVLLILGGLHKGFPYAPLKGFLGTTVKGILTIGSAAAKIEEDLGGPVPILPCRTLEEAVRTGLTVASSGDVLLLSPACASFDQFRDYEERGRQFKELIAKAKAGRLG